MEQIVFENIVGPVMKILSNHITKHLGYATCSTKHVNKMRNKIKVLEDTSTDVKKHMDTNNINDKEVPIGVSVWLDDVENLKKKVQNVSSDGIGCLNLKMRYRAGRKACEDTHTIEELITKNYEFIWTDAPLPTGIVDPIPATSTNCTPSSSSSGGEVFKSRDMPFNNALKFLQQDDNRSQVIALCGMGGVGKTTMMEQLKKVANDEKMFHLIVKVAIGRGPNMLSIQNDIAIGLGGEGLREATETARADSLYRKFKKRLQDDKEKILVLLDDVWEKIELKNIGLTGPLPSGLKLLLTSRNVNVCKQIAADVDSTLNEVKVDVLEEEEAQNLFSQIAGVSREVDCDKYFIGCDIVKECGRLPLAIKIIASTLKFQEDYIWRDTCSRLKNNDFDDKVQEVIKMSYEHIAKDEDREIFLHCGLFHEDFYIPIEDLTKHAWGLNLFINVSTLREARDRTNTCVRNLINANLLIEGVDTGYVKMHDLVLAFVLGRVSKGDYPWIVNHSDLSSWSMDEKSEACKRISLICMGMSEFPGYFKYPNLSFLQLMDGERSLKFPEDFYEHMENLRVISFYDIRYPLLPRSLQCSTNLKTLCLDGCELMFDCSFVGDLVNLEVLSFVHCRIRKLPSTIRKLTKLKLLDLTGCAGLHIDDGAIKDLKNLEELYMRVSLSEAIRFTDANFEELKMLSSQLYALEVEFVEKTTRLIFASFIKLDKFKISVGCLLEQEEDYNFQNTLKLVTDSSKDLIGCKISELFKKTEKLHLQVEDMTRLEDIVSHHPYTPHSYFYLRDLVVSHCEKLIYLFPISVAHGLRKLERLKISSCSVMEAIVSNGGSEINCVDEMIKFEKLKFLCLENLPKLECLFYVDNIVELPQLVELEVDGLPKFTSIYPDVTNISSSQRPFFNSQVRTLVLKKLKVKSMEKLTQIWDCNSEDEVKNISLLREIEMEGCDSVVNLFPTNPMRLLIHLERLTVKKCPSIVAIFNLNLECVHEVGKSSLKSIVVEDSKMLRELWRIKGGEDNSSIFCGFEAIESITISGCKRFRNVFTRTNTKLDMRAVLDINVYECGESGRHNEILVNVISSEEIPEVVENYFNVAFPSYVMPSFPHQVSYLSLSKSKRVKVVFEISSGESATSTPHDTRQQIQLFPHLIDLRLEDMEKMTHVWKCENWNKFLPLGMQHPQSSFHNLTTIHLDKCNRIKYLFSPLMVKLLSKLKTINLYSCGGMKEVVSNRDDKDEEDQQTIATFTTATFFPHLHSLSFHYLGRLKCIGGGVNDKFKLSQVNVASWSLCQYPREIDIIACNALSSVIPSYVVGQMQKLQVLKVGYCDSLIEIFETQNNNNARIDEGNGGTNTTNIPRLENISVPQLSNLTKLVITSCSLLQHVFTFSSLESLRHLEELKIESCKSIKVIVREECGEQTRVVMLPHLKSLELVNLSDLKGFFLGKNEFQWPSLEKVMISKCLQIKVFTSGWSTAPELKYIHTSMGKHSLECGLNFHVTTNQVPSSESTSSCSAALEQLPWSFHNLIEIDVRSNWEVKKIIPSNELLHLQKLERIQVEHYGGLEEIFDTPQTVVEVPNLTQLKLRWLYMLKFIWRSNYHQRAVLLFPNLTTLSIDNCNKLKHVFTSSMVGSLYHLQDLHISQCENLKVIVNEEESEVERDAEVKEIVKLPSLKYLKLKHLISLQGFCLGKDDFSLPLLNTLEITKCPKLTIFTEGNLATPALNVIDTGFGRCYIREEEINSFIKTKIDEGFSFSLGEDHFYW